VQGNNPAALAGQGLCQHSWDDRTLVKLENKFRTLKQDKHNTIATLPDVHMNHFNARAPQTPNAPLCVITGFMPLTLFAYTSRTCACVFLLNGSPSDVGDALCDLDE
jgi:hypothetical protein